MDTSYGFMELLGQPPLKFDSSLPDKGTAPQQENGFLATIFFEGLLVRYFSGVYIQYVYDIYIFTGILKHIHPHFFTILKKKTPNL